MQATNGAIDTPGRRAFPFGCQALEIPKALGYNRIVPTIIREQGYKIQAYVRDHMPPHVHVWKDGRYASFTAWNDRVQLYDNCGLKESQVKVAAELCAKHYDRIVSTLKEMPWVK